MLRCLNFLEIPEEGHIKVGDVDIDAQKYSSREVNLLRRQFAMVFQHYNLFRNRTCLQNVTESYWLIRSWTGKAPKSMVCSFCVTLDWKRKEMCIRPNCQAVNSSA